MKYLLGIDFGGGASKATLINVRGEIVCRASSEYPMLYPHNGWAEQEPESLYQAFVQNVKSILEQPGICAEDIAALSLDGGTHIAVLLDEKNEVIRPAIYWSDTRSVQQARLLEPYRERIAQLSRNTPGPLWTLPQLMWLREREPEHFKRIAHILFLKDYIRYRITGNMATDAIEAMGSMLLDVNTGRWSPWLCSLCGVRVDQLPEIREPTDIIGTPVARVCHETGLSSRTLVCAGATDTAMEVYASGAIRTGQMTLKLATAGRICPITDHAITDPFLVCYRHVIPGLWYPGTATKTCASSMRWYRDVLSGEERMREKQEKKSAYKLIDFAAEQIPAGSDGLFFHPYLQGEITPYADAALRASFTNVSSFHTKEHFDRAVMEGVAYSLRDCMEVLYRLGVTVNDTVRIIGGGSKSAVWRQIVADVLDMPLCQSLTDDSSVGSAIGRRGLRPVFQL